MSAEKMHLFCNYEIFECTFEAPYYISLFFPFFLFTLPAANAYQEWFAFRFIYTVS